MPSWIDEFAAWWSGVPPEWALLIALPFAVAAVGLLATRGSACE